METKVRRCKHSLMTVFCKAILILTVCILLLSDHEKTTEADAAEKAAGAAENNDVSPACFNESGEIIYNKIRYTVISKPASGKMGRLAAAGFYGQESGEIVIPAVITCSNRKYKVVKISDQSFEKSGVTSVVIGKNVSEIGTRAFADCSALNEVTFNNGVSFKVGTASFYGCSKLSKINWTEDTKLKSVGTAAFAFTALKDIVLPDSCQTVDDAAFYGCSGLVGFCFGEKCKDIGQGAFDGCPELELTGNKKNSFLLIDKGVVYSVDGKNILSAGGASGDVLIRKGVSEIPAYFFEGNKRITKLILPDSVKVIGECAFKDCKKLKTVVFGNKLTTISRNAFYNCSSLSEIRIPASVNKIIQNPFMFCPKLSKLTVDGNNQVYGSVNNMLCSKDLKTVIAAPCVGKKVRLNSKTRVISFFAFAGNTRMKKLILNNKLKSVGPGAFYGCSSLTFVYVPNRKIDFSAEPWQVDEEEDQLLFCGIFAGCPEGMEINLPYNAKAGEIGSIEYYIQQQCNNSAILTQR